MKAKKLEPSRDAENEKVLWGVKWFRHQLDKKRREAIESDYITTPEDVGEFMKAWLT